MINIFYHYIVRSRRVSVSSYGCTHNQSLECKKKRSRRREVEK